MTEPNIGLTGNGRILAAVREQLAREDGLREAAEGDRVDVTLALTDGYRPWGRRPEEHGQAVWLPVHVDTGTAVIGPAAVPGERGCPSCALSRESKARANDTDLASVRELHSERLALPDVRLTTVVAAAVAQLVTGQVRALADGLPTQVRGGVVRVRLDSLSTTTHRFLPEPDCPDCAGLPDDSREAAVFTPEPVPKLSPDTHRVRVLDAQDLADTYVDPYYGLVRATQRTAYRTFPTIAAPMGVRTGVDQTEMGFGRDLDFDTCETTAVAEAVERYGGMRPGGRRTVVRGSYSDLAEEALDPRTLGLYPEDRYELRGFPYRRYDHDTVLKWVWGYSFGRGKPVLVPESCAYYRLHDHGGGEDSFVYEISNGCALGGCLEEAVLHGVLELAERDSFLLTWYARLPVPEVDLRSARNTRLRLMAERIRSRTGYEVRVFDTTSENGIPSAAVYGVRDSDALDAPKLMCAAGSAFLPERAIANALLELAPLLEWRSADFVESLPDIERMLDDPYQVRSMHDHSLVNAHPKAFHRFDFLFGRDPEPRGVEESFRGRVRADAPDIAADLASTVDLFLSRGMDVVMVDQTTDEHRAGGLSCVKVLIPGLLPMTFGHWARRVDGIPRLFDLPVKLGYRDTPLTRAEINPHPHPFP